MTVPQLPSSAEVELQPYLDEIAGFLAAEADRQGIPKHMLLPDRAAFEDVVADW